ncbi:MAG: DUF1493 family protein [Rikenellaceae bacterium]
MKTKQRVIELISAKAELSSSDIEVSNDLRDDLDLDSLDLIELLMDLEKEFNVTVPDELTGGITDVQSVIDVVESIIKESATK